MSSNKNKVTQEEEKKKEQRVRRFIITEFILGLCFLIPAQVLSFYGSTNLIIGTFLFLSSLLIARLGQLYMLNKTMSAKLFGVIALIVLILGIIVLIFSGPLNQYGVISIILSSIGVIIGLRIWMLIIFLLSGDFTDFW